jgi:hypothetical protein
MYNDEEPQAVDAAKGREAPQHTAVERFESWLRSHGFQPERDPFFPDEEFDSTSSAMDLVAEYLQDRPQEMSNRAELLSYAWEMGDAAPQWGALDSGLAGLFREGRDGGPLLSAPRSKCSE